MKAARSDVQPLLRDLRRRLDALYGDRLARVVLYGSHARGEAHAESDVDVMIVLRGEVDAYAEIERLSEPLYDAQLDFAKVDHRVSGLAPPIRNLSHACARQRPARGRFCLSRKPWADKTPC